MWITNIEEMTTGFYFMRLRKPEYPIHIVKIVFYEGKWFVLEHGKRGDLFLEDYFGNEEFPEGFEFKKVELPE